MAATAASASASTPATCWRAASTSAPPTSSGAWWTDCTKLLGKRRLRCLHLNDSQTPLGSNRDRHAPPGDGEIGTRGCAAFLSEPRFEKLPVLFEGPGVEGKAVGKVDIDRMRELRRNGRRARARRSR